MEYTALDWARFRTPWGAPPGPDITVYAISGGWSETQFVETIRTGTTPYGKALNPEFMPWEVYAKMTDDELVALCEFMGSLVS